MFILFCALVSAGCGLEIGIAVALPADFSPASVVTTLNNILLPESAQADGAHPLLPAEEAPAPLPTRAPTVLQAAPTVPPQIRGSVQPQVETKRVPVYASPDFLTGYLAQNTSPIIVDGKPWDNGSSNYVQYQFPGGGTSYWDYWPDTEPWDSGNHMWQDNEGNWHTYKMEKVKNADGATVTAYVLVDRPGPGVMDKLWFTNEPVRAFINILNQANLFFSTDPPDLREWGNLHKLGNLRIQVDDRIVYDGPIRNWMSGEAQHLTSGLQDILVWRYGQFGSDGNIIPIPYNKSIKISVYGGVSKPKWFMATGITLPAGTHVKSYTGEANDLPLDRMTQLAANVANPENYLRHLPNQRAYQLVAQPGQPAELSWQGAGALTAIQFEVSKAYDPKRLGLKVQYGGEVGIDLPLIAFFGEPDQVSLHHSAPIGILDVGNAYLFYSNLPMPFHNGMKLQVTTDGQQAVPLDFFVATTTDVHNTQLRVQYRPAEKLAIYGPDYQVNVPGSGKLVGLVLASKDQGFDQVPRVMSSDGKNEDSAKRKWPMGYLEGNLTISDGAGSNRYYSGQEDWAESGFYFNSGYTVPPGGSNRPFGGILRYKEGKDGYATLFRYFNDLSAFRFQNGLRLSFGHGTWHNNFPVRYGVTLFYYLEIPGLSPVPLPASDYGITTGAP